MAENRRVRVLLSDAFSGQTREIILRVELPAFQRSQHLLLPVTLQYEDTLEARRVTIDQPGVIFETADEAPCRAQRSDEDVLRAACRSEVDRAKMEALLREFEGDLSVGTTHCSLPKRRFSLCCHRTRHDRSSRRSGR